MKCYAEYAYDKMPEVKEKVSRLLAEPDSIEAKHEYYVKNKENSFENDPVLWKEIGDALEKYSIITGLVKSDELVEDIFSAVGLYGVLPEEYIQFEFYLKNDKGRREYMCDKERFIMFRPFYNFSKYECIRDKWLQYKNLKKYFARECLYMGESNECATLDEFKEFLYQHPSFIFKPVRASCGKGVELIDSQLGKDEDLYDSLKKIGGVVDQYINQDPVMAQFHSSSVNTVRLIALRGNDRKNHYTQALFRTGIADGIVDNSDKAVRAMVDVDTGIVFSCGTDSYGNKYIYHPDTEIPIVGFQIPRWGELLEIADQVMEELSEYARFIGFDFALSTEGWKIVEINPFPQLVTQQIAINRGSKRIFADLLYRCIGEQL